MSNATVSTVFGLILLSAVSVTSISDVYAKSMPSARPELSLAISIGQDEPKLEDGKIIYERQHMTEEKLQMLYRDLEKVDRLFDTVMLPAVNDFVEKHMEDIDEKYTDEIHITYYRENDRIDIMFVQHPEGLRKSIQIIPESSVRLEMVDNIRVEIPISTMILYGDNPLHYLMPNTSVRVGYLSNYMEELIKKYQNEIIDSHFRTILSFMLDDMSKTTIYLDERHITEYETGIDLVLANPIGAYQIPEFSTNALISVVKSSNHRLTVTCASPDGDEAKMTLSLSYPNGDKVSVDPTLVHNPAADYSGIEFSLKAEEPEGLYGFVLNDAEPKKLVYCHMNVNRGNDHPFEYVVQPESETITVRDVRLIDDSYNIITLPEFHSNARVQISLTNNSDFEHHYVYILLIKNSQGITDFISMVNGTLPARGGIHNLNSELWCIKNPGVYSAEIYIWDDLSDPLPLSSPYSMRGIGMNLEGVIMEEC